MSRGSRPASTPANHWRGHVDRREPLADAFDEGVAPADEERHVGAERSADASAAARAASQAPEAVQREQRRRRVGAAAAHAGARGHALVDRDVGAERRAARALQRARGAQAQVVVGQRLPEVVACSRPSSRRSKCSVSHQSISTNSDCSR